MIRDMLKIIASSDIRSIAVKGALVLGAGNSCEKILRFLRNIILTRLLIPEAFGIMAIIMAITTAIESFTQIGTNLSIIHDSSGRKKTFLNTALLISVFRSSILFCIVFTAAPWIAELYGNSELTILMRIGFISILLNGAICPMVHVALKDMDFRKWVYINHGGNVCGILITIALAIYLKNVWALVLGFLIEAAFRTILSYVLCPFWPSFKTDKESRKSLIHYARGMIGLPILTFIFNRADIFILGKKCSMSELGLYTMAITIAVIPSEVITSIIYQVFMPIFTKVQSDTKQIWSLIISITEIIAFILIPLIYFGFFFGKDFLVMIYGVEYGSMSIPFSVVLLSVMIQLIAAPIASYFFAIGKPSLNRRFAAIRAFVVLIGMYPAVAYFGPIGAAATLVAASSAGIIIQILHLGEYVKYDLLRYFRLFLIANIISIPVIVMGYCQPLLPIQINNIVPGIIGCILSYLFVLALVNNFNIVRIR